MSTIAELKLCDMDILAAYVNFQRQSYTSSSNLFSLEEDADLFIQCLDI